MRWRDEEFTAAVKAAAWARCGGHCEGDGCGAPFSAANTPQYDHRVAAALGGEATLDNCRVLGSRCCHPEKTKADVTRIAKAKRLVKDAANIRPRRKALIPGSKGTRFKKKIDGSVVPR